MKEPRLVSQECTYVIGLKATKGGGRRKFVDEFSECILPLATKLNGPRGKTDVTKHSRSCYNHQISGVALDTANQ